MPQVLKKSIRISILGALAFVLLHSAGLSQEGIPLGTIDGSIYRNESLGMTLKAPNGWELTQKDNQPTEIDSGDTFELVRLSRATRKKDVTPAAEPELKWIVERQEPGKRATASEKLEAAIRKLQAELPFFVDEQRVHPVTIGKHQFLAVDVFTFLDDDGKLLRVNIRGIAKEVDGYFVYGLMRYVAADDLNALQAIVRDAMFK
jgi:hypothetical protein